MTKGSKIVHFDIRPPEDLVWRIDEYRASQRPLKSRAETARALIDMALSGKVAVKPDLVAQLRQHAALAEMSDVSVNASGAVVSKRVYRVFTDEERVQIDKLLDEGRPDEEIAKLFNARTQRIGGIRREREKAAKE